MKGNLVHTITLNNTAVGLLVEGDLMGAFVRLQQALRMMQGSSLCERDDEGEVARPTGCVQPVALHSSLMGESPRAVVYPHVYNHAFLLVSPSVLADGGLDEATVLVALLYNFGLVLQKRGLTEVKESHLDNALKIYALARNTLNLEGGSDMTANQRGLSLLSLALGNNVASIFSGRMDYGGATLAMGWMHDLLLSNHENEDTTVFRQTLFYHELCGWPTFSSPAA